LRAVGRRSPAIDEGKGKGRATTMGQSSQEAERSPFGAMLIAAAGVILLAVAIALSFFPPKAPLPLESAVTAPAATAPAATAPAATSPPAATFDVVRVEPSGAAVFAGRAEPKTRVVVQSGKETIGEATANERGEWLVIPADPLLPGSHELSVGIVDEKGDIALADDVVVVIVPPRAADAVTPLAVKTPRSGTAASTVLQAMGGDEARPIAIETVDHRHGRLTIAGRAPPNARLRLYLDGLFLGEVAADSLGLWRLPLDRPMPPGAYQLRADQVADEGRVLARARVPLTLADGTATVGAPAAAIVVERGDSLWSIARSVYGEGTAYLLIYDANRRQIDDPDLIYPGQVFDLPNAR
jgi:nucleoid-associated protein YgaU